MLKFSQDPVSFQHHSEHAYRSKRKLLVLSHIQVYYGTVDGLAIQEVQQFHLKSSNEKVQRIIYTVKSLIEDTPNLKT